MFMSVVVEVLFRATNRDCGLMRGHSKVNAFSHKQPMYSFYIHLNRIEYESLITIAKLFSA
jgi:hypothetical protein